MLFINLLLSTGLNDSLFISQQVKEKLLQDGLAKLLLQIFESNLKSFAEDEVGANNAVQPTSALSTALSTCIEALRCLVYIMEHRKTRQIVNELDIQHVAGLLEHWLDLIIQLELTSFDAIDLAFRALEPIACDDCAHSMEVIKSISKICVAVVLPNQTLNYGVNILYDVLENEDILLATSKDITLLEQLCAFVAQKPKLCKRLKQRLPLSTVYQDAIKEQADLVRDRFYEADVVAYVQILQSAVIVRGCSRTCPD